MAELKISREAMQSFLVVDAERFIIYHKRCAGQTWTNMKERLERKKLDGQFQKRDHAIALNAQLTTQEIALAQLSEKLVRDAIRSIRKYRQLPLTINEVDQALHAWLTLNARRRSVPADHEWDENGNCKFCTATRATDSANNTEAVKK